jgi:branched-chain amino acid transport system ATP-binding protein
MTTNPPSVSDTPVLKLSNVESAYGPIRAIRGVSLQVRRGEIATVLGSNGAGKTTILKTISGIIDPRKGSVEFKGDNITANDPAHIVRQGLSHVPEGREVFPLLTVHDNLLMGAYTRQDRDGVARDMEAVYGYFPILRERATQDAGLLSGGQQQMLAIGRGLMARPRLLLLDEPSLGLAPAVVDHMFDIISTIHDEGVAILLVEQNVARALGIAGRAYVLEEGRIVAAGSPSSLLGQTRIREAYLGVRDHEGGR